MRRTYKKFFACILLLLAVTGFDSSNTAYADTPPKLSGVIDLANDSADRTGQGWSWDAQKKVLTLSGVDLRDNDQANVFILLPADTIIHLEDGTTNKITANAERIILVNGDLTIEGAGRLVLDGDHNMEGQALRVLGNLTINGADLEVYNCRDGIACQAPNEAEDGWGVGRKSDKYGNISILNSNIVMDNFTAGGIKSTESQKINASTIKVNNSLNWGIYCINGRIECNQATLSLDKVRYGMITTAATMNNSELSITQQGENGSGIYMINWSIRDPLTTMRNLVINGGQIKIQSDGSGIDFEGYQLLDIKDAAVTIDSNYCGILGQSDNEAVEEKKVRIENSLVQITAPVSIMIGQDAQNGIKRDIHDVICITEDMFCETKHSWQLIEVKIDGFQIKNIYLYTLLPTENMLEEHLYGEADSFPDELLVNSMEGKGELKLVPKNDSSAAKKEAIAVYVNGQAMAIDPANDGSVYIDENGRTIVPLRALAGALGIVVEWDSEKQTITIPNGPKGTVVFTIGSKEYSMEGTVKTMDTTAVSLPPGRTHVPLRFVAESLGAQVEMSSEADGTARIMITTGK